MLDGNRQRLTAFDVKDRDYASAKQNCHGQDRQTPPRLDCDERHLLARRILQPPAIGPI